MQEGEPVSVHHHRFRQLDLVHATVRVADATPHIGNSLQRLVMFLFCRSKADPTGFVGL